jgi:hypothetical protein
MAFLRSFVFFLGRFWYRTPRLAQPRVNRTPACLVPSGPRSYPSRQAVPPGIDNEASRCWRDRRVA